MSRRETNKRRAQETMKIIENGFYSKGNHKIDISNELKNSIDNTMLLEPTMGRRFYQMVKAKEEVDTVFEVVNTTTLKAAKELKEKYDKVVCLNFASAKNPGGGFLNGSMAQEESLAIASGLYPTINQMQKMYDYNRNLKTCLYSDHMIYSPDVPVFRADNGDLLESPYQVSFITSPAVNKGVVVKRESYAAQQRIHTVMKERIQKILSIGVHYEYDAIVLGAFGCGVFKNNPKDVAVYFKEALEKDSKIKNQFKNVTFAILDNTDNQHIINPFKQVFHKE